MQTLDVRGTIKTQQLLPAVQRVSGPLWVNAVKPKDQVGLSPMILQPVGITPDGLWLAYAYTNVRSSSTAPAT